MKSNRTSILQIILALALCFVLFRATAAYSADKTTPIRLGATISLEGSYAEPSQMIQDSYRLWAAQINGKGGLLGRDVELVLYDDKSQKDRVRQLYEKLIVEDGVDLVLSPYGTPLTLAASEITEKHGKTLLACAAAGEEIWERGYRFVFGIYALADRYFISFNDILARRGSLSVGIVYADSPFHRSIARGAADWAKRFGLEVMLLQSFLDPQADYTGIIERLKSENPAGVIFSAYPPDSYRFLEMLQIHQYRPRALGMTIAPVHPDFYRKVGPFAERIFAPSQWEPDERIPFPGTIQFIEDFQSFAGRMPSYHAGSAYAACQILENAVRHAGRIDHQEIRAYLASLDTVTVIGRFKVDRTGRQIGHNPILIQWQNGRKEIVYPGKMKTAAPNFETTRAP